MAISEKIEVLHACRSHVHAPQLCLLSLFVEDILDEVSGLTVDSQDDTLGEGPQLKQQSPGGHQEDRSFMGTGQKVGSNTSTYRSINATDSEFLTNLSFGIHFCNAVSNYIGHSCPNPNSWLQ